MTNNNTSGKSRRWVFTLNNPENTMLFNELPQGVEYIIWQRERGEEGTEHLQGYVRFKNPQGLTGARRVISERAHMEIANGTEQQCIDYCSKADTKVEGPFSFGTVAAPGKRNDILDAAVIAKREGSIKNVPLDLIVKYSKGFEKVAAMDRGPFIRNVRILCLWGGTGVGKSYIVNFNAETLDLYKGMTWNSSGQVWVDGYDGEKTILIDDMKPRAFPVEKFLWLTDNYQLQMECKGGMKWMKHTCLIITANDDPDEWYPNISSKSQEAVRRRLGIGKWKDKDHMTFHVESREDVQSAWNEFMGIQIIRPPTPPVAMSPPMPSPVLKRRNAEIITIDDD